MGKKEDLGVGNVEGPELGKFMGDAVPIADGAAKGLKVGTLDGLA